MKFNFWKLPIAVALVLLCVGHPAAAQTPSASSTLQTVLKRGTIVIGTRSTALPFSFKDEKGDLVGFDIDLAHELARGLFKDAAKVEFVILSNSADRVASLQSNRVDAVITGFSVYLERTQVVDFTTPYMISDNIFVVKTASPIQKYADLVGKLIVTRQGADVEALIKNVVPNPQIQGYPEVSDAFLAYRQGRGDAFFYERAASMYYARQFPGQFRAIEDREHGIDVSPIAIGVRQGDQVWLNYLNWALYSLKASGKLQELHKKWLGTEELEPNWVRQPL
ncbi:MAG TPA: transporter substrate-binding domain-containing protein [Stellaceae bacterium]|nr:transporter substrate-binding domain-containing protein [Stellaceae bacterium]